MRIPLVLFVVAGIGAAHLFPIQGAAAEAPRVPRFFDAAERLALPAIDAGRTIRFATTSDFPPFNAIGANGSPTGYNIDLAREICREIARIERCSIQALPPAGAVAALRNGEVEAMIAGLAISPAARDEFLFTRNYMMFPARFVTRSRSPAPAEGWTGNRVGVMSGSAHERLLRDYFPGAKVVTYARQEWALSDLTANKLDAVFGDGMGLSFWLAGEEGRGCCGFSGGPYVSPEYLGFGLSIALRRDNDDLASAFDYALRELERKGVTGELYLRYFPVGFF